MDELEVVLDRDMGLWALSAPNAPGVAGVATARLDDGIRVHVDAASGAVLEIEVDATGDGSVSSSAGSVLEWLIEDRLTRGGTTRIRSAVAPEVIELAILEGAVDDATALGDPSPWWFAELDVRRRRLGIRRDVAGPLDRHARARSAVALSVTDDDQLDRELGLLADEVGIRSDEPLVVGLEAARRRVADAAVELGRLPAGAGTMQVDPGFVQPGLLDLRAGCDVEEDGPSAVTLRAPVAEVYATQLSSVVAVVIDDNDVPVCMSTMGVGPGGGGHGAAVANLVLHPERDRSTVRVLVTSAPTSLPSVRLLARRDRARTARLAARLARLGDREAAERLWARATDGAGSTSERFEPWPMRPFAAELVG